MVQALGTRSVDRPDGRDRGGEGVRVLVVASDPLARSGIAVRLADEPTVSVAGLGAPDDDPVALLALARPEAVLWDLGTAPVHDLPPGAPGPLVVLVDETGAAARAIGAGARGVLPRASDGPRLAASLVAAARGLLVLDDSLASLLERRGSGTNAEGLTRRELEVLSGLAAGLANKQIAHRLGITEHTAKFHVNSILEKLGARSRVQAVVTAARLGLVALY